MPLDSATSIVGFGDAYADGEERSPLELAASATADAIEDARISKSEIDGVLTGRRPFADMRPQWNNIFASYVNIPNRYSTEVTTHGGGVLGTLKHALAAIESGLAETVLCVQSDAVQTAVDQSELVPSIDADEEFEYPYGPIMPSLYGQIADRYLYETDATREQMAKLAVEVRKWGVRHPKAAMAGKDEITVEDVLESRPITSELNLYDCAPWGGGGGGTGGALIVTASDRTDSFDTEPIYVRGVGEYNTHESITDRLALRGQKPNLPEPNITTTGAREAARQAYEMAGLEPADVDVVEASVNFTHMGLLLLEELGFCEPGRGGQFVEDGGIDFEDGLAFSTNGAWLSFGQPGISCTMDLLVEAVRQIRDTALGVQVPDARTAIVQGGGGATSCNNVCLLSSADGGDR
jgi:acetyl-CoA acetyltransferase